MSLFDSLDVDWAKYSAEMRTGPGYTRFTASGSPYVGGHYIGPGETEEAELISVELCDSGDNKRMPQRWYQVFTLRRKDGSTYTCEGGLT